MITIRRLFIYSILLSLSLSFFIYKRHRDISEFLGLSHAESQLSSFSEIALSPMPVRSLASHYLLSTKAQNTQDWDVALKHVTALIAFDPENIEHLKRAIILSAGVGDLKSTQQYAQTLTQLAPDVAKQIDVLPLLTGVYALQKNDIVAAKNAFSSLQTPSLQKFVQPLLLGWIAYGQNDQNLQNDLPIAMHAIHKAEVEVLKGDCQLALPKIDAVVNDVFMGQGQSSLPMLYRAAVLYTRCQQTQKAQDVLGKLARHQNDTLYPLWLLDRITADRNDAFPDIAPLPAEGADAKIAVVKIGVAQAFFDIAVMLYHDNDLNSARLFAQLSMVLDPNFMAPKDLMTDLFVRFGHYDHAISMVQKTDYTKFLPKLSENWLHKFEQRQQIRIAQYLDQAGRLDEAVSLLTNLYQQTKDENIMMVLGNLYASHDDFIQANKIYKTAYKADEDQKQDWYSLYLYALTLEKTGQWPRARAVLEKAVTQTQHPDLLNYLGYGMIERQEDPKQALEYLKKAVLLDPQNGAILDSLGWAYVQLKQYNMALPLLEKAQTIIYDDAVINDHLGDVYWYLNRHADARFQWNRAVNFTKDDVLLQKINQKITNGLPEE